MKKYTKVIKYLFIFGILSVVAYYLSVQFGEESDLSCQSSSCPTGFICHQPPMASCSGDFTVSCLTVMPGESCLNPVRYLFSIITE
jgi:hypothetical protein